MSATKLGILDDAERHLAVAIAKQSPETVRRRQDLAILARCVEICRAYSMDKVVMANIRRELQSYFEPSPDINLFAMALLHHVQNPEDRNLFECTRWVYWQLLQRKPEQVAG